MTKSVSDQVNQPWSGIRDHLEKLESGVLTIEEVVDSVFEKIEQLTITDGELAAGAVTRGKLASQSVQGAGGGTSNIVSSTIQSGDIDTDNFGTIGGSAGYLYVESGGTLVSMCQSCFSFPKMSSNII